MIVTIKIINNNEEGKERKRNINIILYIRAYYSAARGKYDEARNIRDISNYSAAYYECHYECTCIILRRHALCR